MTHDKGNRRVEETPGWIITLDEATRIDGKPCELYLAPDGTYTSDIERAEFFPMTEGGGMTRGVAIKFVQCFFMPRPGFHEGVHFVTLKVLRTVTVTQETRLL